ncbi:hypothetical protein L596_013995 [Steinernema carpocapsae]|uniref:7TM GPCR serpentine receptor class x (Srx) domain-containing protein n=1 Tax=Steinernema carpocapsae TaxID=34508 RepID=A0A4U5NBD5_STECR|nr:hypothetical protein L596_013995 [Steinernema carpocapsae]
MLENCICWSVCLTTIFFDGATLLKIIYIKQFRKNTSRDKNYRRDVRFFAQSAIQNIAMMAALSTIVVVNNSEATGNVISYVLAVDIFIVSNITNGLVLVIFNPEVRQAFFWRVLPNKATASISSTTCSSGPLIFASPLYTRNLKAEVGDSKNRAQSEEMKV